MTSKTVTLTRVEYDRIMDGVDALRTEIVKQQDEIKKLTAIAWEHGNRADAAEVEVERLRSELSTCRDRPKRNG